jgi:hypothetical protein
MNPDFQDFQRAFARHLRDPHHAPRPAGVPARRMAVYNELLFNNICGFVDSCFPVCRATLGEKRWRRLCRTFYRDWPAQTPWFREIPHEFIRYLNEAEIRQPLPAWLIELAHYEWAELAVDTMLAETAESDPAGNLLIGRPVLNPTLMRLTYQWPVHRIGPTYRPRQPQTTCLLIFRDADDKVQFMTSNPLTHRLLALFADEGLNGRAACLRIAEELQHSAPETLVSHGHSVLQQLHQQGVIQGSRP